VRLFAPLLAGAARPAMALSQPPMLAATLCMNTTTECAMTDLIALARQAETRPGVQAVTVFGGFPIADLRRPASPWSWWPTPRNCAADVAAELGREAWRRRAEYVYHEEPLAALIDLPAPTGLADGTAPVLLLDHGDNCMSGGACDVMDVLEMLLAGGHDGIAVGPIADPEVVAQLFAAGEGAEIRSRLATRPVASGLPAPRPPLRLRGRVTALSDGRYRVSRADLSRAAAFDGPNRRLSDRRRPDRHLRRAA
jgi:microcystin degradation protein MlrC